MVCVRRCGYERAVGRWWRWWTHGGGRVKLADRCLNRRGGGTECRKVPVANGSCRLWWWKATQGLTYHSNKTPHKVGPLTRWRRKHPELCKYPGYHSGRPSFRKGSRPTRIQSSLTNPIL